MKGKAVSGTMLTLMLLGLLALAFRIHPVGASVSFTRTAAVEGSILTASAGL